MGRGIGAGGLRLGLVLGHVALGIGLVLLGPPLVLEVLLARDLADDFLGLALHVLDDAVDPVLDAAVLSHGASFVS